MKTGQTVSTNKIESLQFLRGIAVLTVVLHHIKGYTNTVGVNPGTIYDYIPDIFGYGAPLFFTISGFLMALLIDTGYKNFLVRRFVRIYPPYFIAVLIIILLKFLLFGSVPQGKLIYSMTLLPFGTIPYILNVEWTLIYEIFFYFICSIFTLKSLKKFFLPFLLVWAALIGYVYYLYNIPTAYLPTIIQIPFQTLNFFFILGGIAYYMYKNGIKIPNKIGYIIIVVCLAVIYVTYYHILKLNPIFIDLRYLILGVLFAVLTYVILSIDYKSIKFIQKLGDYSYGIYLIHAQLIFTFLTIIKEKLGLPINTLVSTAVLIISLFIGWNYGKFEVKLHRVLKEKCTKLNYKAIYKYATIICLILVTLFCIRQYTLGHLRSTDFDNSKILTNSKTAGWADYISENTISKNEKVTIRGWAVDPIEIKPAKNILVVSDGQVIPSEVKWYSREGIVKIFNSKDVLNSGWELTFNSKYFDLGSHKLEIYAVTSEGKYILLNSDKKTSNTTININN